MNLLTRFPTPSSPSLPPALPLPWLSAALLFLLPSLAVVPAGCDRPDPADPDAHAEAHDVRPIAIHEANPFYWEYDGEPVLLVGGSREDNLFNHPEGLEAHLDTLMANGGNYIRNTMSSRNPGNPWPFLQLEDGRYDLEQWDPEYWERFENLVAMSAERDIIIQIEVWDPWDYFQSEAELSHGPNVGWESNPYNPALNINYTPEESRLDTEIEGFPAGQPSDHLFFHTVPELEDIPVVRRYQERFVEKILSITLRYPNVIYCMNNETGEHPEWGVYWANFIRDHARQQDREVYLADMRYSTDLQTEDHRRLLHDRENFDFFEVSQNNNNVNDQVHYDRLMEIREQILDQPKPLSNVKIYGGRPAWTTSAEEGTRRFWRNVFAGSASVRFHREGPEPHYFGIGLSELARTHIKSMSLFTERFHVFTAEPANHLLGNRDPNEAYALAEPGRQYAVYYTNGGSVELDMSGSEGEWELRWLDIFASGWYRNDDGEKVVQTLSLNNSQTIALQAPGDGQWLALLLSQ